MKITTHGGRVYKNAEVIRFEADGPVIKHDGGTNQIAWRELLPAARQRFQAEARKLKEKEIQRLKRDLARAEAEAARLKQDEGQPERKNPPQARPSMQPKPNWKTHWPKGAASSNKKPLCRASQPISPCRDGGARSASCIR